jgi:hypothetical protein
MRVLVACEYSGRVRDAFLKLGHDAMSCDLLPTDAQGPHHQGDVIAFLNSVEDGYFDLIIGHPECTKLCVSGNSTYGLNKDGSPKPKHYMRLDAAKWTEMFWELCKVKSHSVCFENPVGVLRRHTNMPKANYVQPYGFGHMEQKNTGLYLHNLDPLNETNNVYDEMMLLPKSVRERLHYLPPSPDRWKLRSTTYQGIADAMANQWGSL